MQLYNFSTATMHIVQATFFSLSLPPLSLPLPHNSHRNIHYHFLGLILTLALRIWFSSINPLFFSATLNTLIVIAGTAAAIALYILDWRTPIIRKKEYSRFVQIFSDSYEEVDEDSWSGAVWAGAGFGFLLLVLQSVFANTTIILSWANLPSSKGTAVSFPLE